MNACRIIRWTIAAPFIAVCAVGVILAAPFAVIEQLICWEEL